MPRLRPAAGQLQVPQKAQQGRRHAGARLLHTEIATDDDEIIPYTRCFLRGKKRTVNVTLRDRKPYRNVLVTHQNIYQDPYAKAPVFDALDNPGPANPKRAQVSSTSPPRTGP